MADPLLGCSGEGASFYVPLIADPDPAAANSWFAGLQHVWRTQDNGGSQASPGHPLQRVLRDRDRSTPRAATGSRSAAGSPATSRARFPGAPTRPRPDGLRRRHGAGPERHLHALGRHSPRPRVRLEERRRRRRPRRDVRPDRQRVDAERFVSGIAIDPADPNHAFISFSGYNAYATPPARRRDMCSTCSYNPGTHTATWNEHRLRPRRPADHRRRTRHERRPVRVDRLRRRRALEGDDAWVPASTGLPSVAVYGLTIDRTNTGPVRGHARPQRLAARAELAGKSGWAGS